MPTILAIVILTTVALVCTALASDPIAIGAIGLIVTNVIMGLLNMLKTSAAQSAIADNTVKTVEAKETVVEKLETVVKATNGMKDELVESVRKESHAAGVLEGVANAAAVAKLPLTKT